LAEEKGKTVTVRSRERSDNLREAFRMKEEINQIFYDAEHWNSNHPDEEAINPDPDGALKRLEEGIDKMLAV